MKKYGALIALGLAVVFGIAAVLLTNNYLTQQAGQATVIAPKSEPMGQIVVPASDLEIGTPLAADNLALVDWPEKNIPQGAFKDKTALEGRVAVTRLFRGRPIIAAEMADQGSGAGLVALIPPGKRAMAIRVDEVSGVAGFITPNMLVDVISVEGDKARTFLEKIRVLARSQETYPDEEGKPKIVRTVTMELTPQEAETMALQTTKGRIHLVLRNPLEEEAPPPKPVVKKKPVRTLKPRVTKTKPQPFDVEVLRGTDRDTVRFKDIDSEERQ